MRYVGPVYRPPSEADSYLLQVTYGCSHNECTYCAMYRHKSFSARPLAEVLEDVREAGRRFPGTRRVFLLDGDAMTLSTAKLAPILEALSAAFPDLHRVGSYVNAVSVLKKTDDELRRLRDLKLGIGYLGLETGDPVTAERIVKGATVEEQVEAVRRAQAAGIKMSVMVLLGMGGRDRSKEHAAATAEALSAMDPRYVSCLCVTPVEGTPLFEQVRRGSIFVALKCLESALVDCHGLDVGRSARWRGCWRRWRRRSSPRPGCRGLCLACGLRLGRAAPLGLGV